jgi:acetoin utilization protein AcuB
MKVELDETLIFLNETFHLNYFAIEAGSSPPPTWRVIPIATLCNCENNHGGIMAELNPKISNYMTKTPESICSEASILEAMEIMQDKNIRHLPVKKENKTIGVISDRDIKTLFALAGGNYKAIKVGDVCSDQPYVVNPNSLLSEVVSEMAHLKIGSAVIMEGARLVGIFTTSDACRALAQIIDEKCLVEFSKPVNHDYRGKEIHKLAQESKNGMHDSFNSVTLNYSGLGRTFIPSAIGSRSENLKKVMKE